MCHYLNLPKSITEIFYRLIRASLYSFTFILCILGLSLILFSFWYIYEGANYHLDNSIKFCVFTGSFLIGFLLFSLAVCGLFGVLNEKLIWAKTFLAGILGLMTVELVCIFLIYYYKRDILSHASSLFQKFIVEYADDDDIRSLVDTIQSDLKCCGISSPNDWDRNPYYKCSSISTLACSVPASCCYDFSPVKPKFNMLCGVGVRRNDTINTQYKLIHVTGCKYSIYSFLDYKHKLTSSVLTGILVPQLIGVILIISFILSLSYLIQYDSIDCNKCEVHGAQEVEEDDENYVVEFERHRDLTTEIKPNDSKNLFLLSIGGNNDFLKKSRYIYTNHVYDGDEHLSQAKSVEDHGEDSKSVSNIRY